MMAFPHGRSEVTCRTPRTSTSGTKPHGRTFDLFTRETRKDPLRHLPAEALEDSGQRLELHTATAKSSSKAFPQKKYAAKKPKHRPTTAPTS